MHFAFRRAARAVLATISIVAFSAGTALSQTASYSPPAYKESVTLSSENGVLEVTLTAQQGEITLDTVSAPVRNALLFCYRLVRGKASNGETAAKGL